MAITYLSGGRIQGSSTGSASPTVAKTIFQGAGLESKWVDNSEDISYNATTDVIDFVVSGSGNTDSYATFDLQDSTALNGSSASDTAWILRFKLDITTYTLNHNSSSALVIGISNQWTSYWSASQNGIGFEVGVGNNDTLYRLQTSNSAAWARGSADAVFAETPAVETTYVEVKRTSATDVTVSMYSDSAYSTLLEAETITNVSGTTGLRYLSVKSDTQSEDNLLAGTVSEFELWNAVTSTTQDDKTTITDVPVGTRFEEIDTRKIFRRSAGDENVGTSGTGGDWAEVVFDNSTIANNAVATGNAVTRSSGSDWDSFIRSSTNKLSPATGGGEIYFTQTGSGNHSFGLEKTPFNSAPSAVHTGRDYSFHTTSASNNMYEDATSYSGTAYGGDSNEFRITMAANGAVVYYWRSGNSGSWTTERTSNVTASGDYYVSVSMGNTTSTAYCYIKSDANPTWKEKGTA